MQINKNMNIIMGKNAVTEAIKGGRTINIIYLLDSHKQSDFAKTCEANASVKYVSGKFLQTFGDKHGGVVAEVKEYATVPLEHVVQKNQNKEHVALIMLYGLEDPHNLGAILRTADATKMDAIIIPKHRSVKLNATVAKVSTGAIEYVDVVEVVNLSQTIDVLKKAGYWVIGLEADGKVFYHQQDYIGKIVVVLGSEGRGISRLVKEKCDFLVKIPMYGHITSLNVSVSAALIFYEIIRSRGI